MSRFKNFTDQFSQLSTLINHRIALDIGEFSSSYFLPQSKTVKQVPSVVIRHKSTGEFVFVGHQAQAAMNKLTKEMEVVKPYRDGSLANEAAAETLINYIFQEAFGQFGLNWLIFPLVAASFSSTSSYFGVKTFNKILKNIGSRSTILIPTALAALVGEGVEVLSTKGSVVVILGERVVEMGFVCSGSLMRSRSCFLGAAKLDEMIFRHLMRTKQIFLSSESVAHIRKKMACCHLLREMQDKHQQKIEVIKGVDKSSGLPTTMKFMPIDLLPVMREYVSSLIRELKIFINQFSPVEMVDVLDTGILLVGGLSSLCGLAEILQQELKIPIFLSKNPSESIVRGNLAISQNKSLLKAVKQLNENKK